MSRSSKKGPFVVEKLLAKVIEHKEKGDTHPIKTWARRSSISPEMVGFNFDIYNGKDFIRLFVTESMVGHKLGEFSPTRKFTGHSKKGKVAKSSGTVGRVLKD
jgi:small subunit ribosomal protein S19